MRAHRPRLRPRLPSSRIAITHRSTRASTRIPHLTTSRERWPCTTSCPTSEAVLPNWSAPSHVADHESPRARHLMFHAFIQSEAHPNRHIPGDPSLAESQIKIQYPAFHHKIELFNWNTRNRREVMHKGGNGGVQRSSHGQRLTRQDSDKETPLFDPPFVHEFWSLKDLAAFSPGA